LIKSAVPEPDPGMQIFTTSGIYTVPQGVKKIQAFLVGAGGHGGLGYTRAFSDGDYEMGYGGGGGSGYTTTSKTTLDSDSINITIGAQDDTVGESYSISYGGSTLIDDTIEAKGGRNSMLKSGETGGSPGGSGKYDSYVSGYEGHTTCGDGASDGNGVYTYYTYASPNNGSYNDESYERGQRTTTRAFGESDGTLYAGGGGGSPTGNGGDGGGGNGSRSYTDRANNGGSNTGSGGGGSGTIPTSIANIYITYTSNQGSGGSGIAIIRWGFDKNGNWLGYSTS
jgi:hypothetical protein